MKYFFPMRMDQKHIPDFCYWDNLFNDDEINEIEILGETLLKKNAVVGTQNLTEGFRKNKVSWFDYSKDTEWFVERINSCVRKLNLNYYNFELNSFEDVQYTIYDSVGSKYDYHIDNEYGTNYNTMRKLTVIVFLSSNNNYKGGKLFLNTGIEFEVEQEKGRLVMFPSFMLHKVTPIESGTRKTLVSWVSGPNWR